MKLEINLNSFHPESFSFLDVAGKEIGAYPSFRSKIEYAMACTDYEGPFMSKSLRKALQASGFDFQANKEHIEIVGGLRNAVDACDPVRADDLMLRAALLRGFLG